MEGILQILQTWSRNGKTVQGPVPLLRASTLFESLLGFLQRGRLHKLNERRAEEG